MQYTSKHSGLRWMVLIIVLINSFFNTIYNVLGIPGDSVKTVSDRYMTLFTPAGYAFAIWGIIYLAFIIYAVYQLLPAQRYVRFFDSMVWPLMLANILCMLWQVVFRNYLIGGSVVVILATLLTAVYMRVMVQNETHGKNTWLAVPFSLFLGWICVATIANIASWLVATGWNGGDTGPVLWTVIMLCAALLTGIIISLAYRDFIVPIVVAWALAAIYVEAVYKNSTVADTALILAIVSAIFTAGGFIYFRQLSLRGSRYTNIDA